MQIQMPKQKRIDWPTSIANSVLVKCHHRCCVCPEHRRVSNIHHIDEDPSNSVESNAIGLCGECHPDVHGKSTMRRNITPGQLAIYKEHWEKSCKDLTLQLQGNAKAFSTSYYINAHRLSELYQEVFGRSLFTNLPHKVIQTAGSYNTLWANSKNSLPWTDLAENRSYLESCLRDTIPRLATRDLNLIELGAIDQSQNIGTLVGFSCQFNGKDIPDQGELVEGCGDINGPAPTMRRVVTDNQNFKIFETCMMLDMQYMFADSAFTAFSEDGIWTGIARLIKSREAVGSNDGHFLRDQLILSPISICNPRSHNYVGAKSTDPELQYLTLTSENDN